MSAISPISAVSAPSPVPVTTTTTTADPSVQQLDAVPLSSGGPYVGTIVDITV